jgi:CRISPR-associated endonuclease/helicase Cas3
MSMENASFSFELESHPSKLLIYHLKNVADFSRAMVTSANIVNREVLADIAYLIGISHDFGKSTSFFQQWLKEGKRTNLAYHSLLSAFFGYSIVKQHLLEKGLLAEFWYLPAITWTVIAKHHGNLRNLWEGETAQLGNYKKIENVDRQIENINDNYLEEVQKIYQTLGNLSIPWMTGKQDDMQNLAGNLIKDIRNLTRKGMKHDQPTYYFVTLFLYSVLLDADKLDASNRLEIPERLNISSDLVDKYKMMKFEEAQDMINIVREMAYSEVVSSLADLNLEEDRILSVNLPTGAGKTLTGLSFAIRLRDRLTREAESTPRIIYALPFLSIIDQNAEQIEELFKVEGSKIIPSNLFLKHHHLAEIEYKEESDGELSRESFNRSLLLTEGWHSEIIITTFVQLFQSLITNRNRLAKKFHNMANSIIILDEIQAIPSKYWSLIRTALKYLAYNYNSWIVLMTATQPFIFSPSEIKELVHRKKEYFNAFDRVIYKFYSEKKEFDSFKNEFLQRILHEDSKSYMVILNTVGSCKEMYTYLKEELCRRYRNGNTNNGHLLDEDGICVFPSFWLLNLSTHILPEHRLRRINRIRSRGPDDRVIVITTQLVEAGVDISVDIIYRDLAPLDCIIQAGGRCNRNDDPQKGEVNVINLTDSSGNKRQFWSYVYNSVLVNATKEVLERYPGSISESDFVGSAIEEYYRRVIERTSKTESRKIIESLRKLNFSDISAFRLIEEELKKVSVFVEVDKEAERVRNQIEEIATTKGGFERKLEMRKIRKEMNSYTLSTYLKDKIEFLCRIKGFDNYFCIRREELDQWYKKDTGLYLGFEDTDLSIL